MGGAAGAAEQSLVALEKRLQESLWKVHNLQLSVENFTPGNQETVNSRINELIGGMKDLDALGEPLKDVKIPVDLLRYVDEGGNPDIFAAETLKKCQEENQRSKGKVLAFQELHSQVLKKAEQAFPEDTKMYLGMVDRATPASGGAANVNGYLPNGGGAP